MKPNVPATLLATLVAGLAAASGQTPTNFADGISVGSSQAIFDTFPTGTLQTAAQIRVPNGGLNFYAPLSETSLWAMDGGITLQGKPLRMVIGADTDPVNGETGTFEIWKLNDFWGSGAVNPVFKIDTAAQTGNFNALNVSITNGTLSVAGSPVLTAATAASTYITTAQANTNYPLKTALPLFGTEGTNFDRANGSATFGSGSYALGINNFSSGAARIGKDNGLNWQGTGGNPNATSPIPYTNFKNNAAFGTSIIGNGLATWTAGQFTGTEKAENTLTSGSSSITVAGGSQVSNSVALGGSKLTLTPNGYATTLQSGISVLGSANVTSFGSSNLSDMLVGGKSTVALRHFTSNPSGTNRATALSATVLGESYLSMHNVSSSASPNSDYVTLAGKSKAVARSNHSATYSTALGKSAIISTENPFNQTNLFGDGSEYFPGTDRWTGVNPRLDTTFGFAAGESVVANGSHGTALGKARVYADYGTAIGEGVDAGTAGTSVTGRYNKLQQYTYAANEEGTMQQFVVGNGTGDADADRSNALVVERAGLTTLTNKSWKANVTANPGEELADPPSPSNNDRGGDALAVEGHTRLKGKVLIQPQGDLSMGGFTGGEQP